MTDIAQKSIGFMIDELVTTSIKALHKHEVGSKLGADLEVRKAELARAIEQRLQASLTKAPTSEVDSPASGLGKLVAELTETLILCWNAQEVVMQGGDATQIASAAQAAQRLNAKRNTLIRELDGKLGEGAITATAKTYG